MPRTAIVTGSARGIGEAIARRLAKEGYRVCINDVLSNAEQMDKIVQELNKTYGEKTAIGYVADVSKSTEVKNMIEESVSALGPLTVMVANAGIAQVTPVLEISDEDVQRMFNVNFIGVWNCYTCAAIQMISQGPVEPESTGYKIIGAASIVAFKPFPLLSHYSASKWAVRGFTQVRFQYYYSIYIARQLSTNLYQVFAMEMARHKIQVNCYAPGIVGTSMWDLIDEKLGEIEGRPKGESVKKYSTDLTAMGRVSEPEDVANVVGGFLCGKDSNFVTGQTIVVDGGIIFT